MRLSDIFTGKSKSEDIGRNQKTGSLSPSRAAAFNRQIRSLVPGQTFQGEILSRHGGDIQIRLADDFVLNAKLDQNLNIEVGKNMTFEVKNNGSSLTLSPLFANVATDVNVLKALDMAGISANETSVAMTEQMMEAGLPIDKSSIQQLYREINAFPDAEISDIINLHKLGLSVNEENVNQMIAYRNLNYQLAQGIETVMDLIPDMLDALVAKGDLEGASGMYRELLQLAGQAVLDQEILSQEIPSGEETLTEEAFRGETLAGNVSGGEILEGSFSADHVLDEAILMKEVLEQGNQPKQAENAVSDVSRPLAEQTQMPEIPKQLRESLAQTLHQALSLSELSSQETEQLSRQILQFENGETKGEGVYSVLSRLLEQAAERGSEGRDVTRLLLSRKEFREMPGNTLREAWSLRPQDVAEPDKVESFYRRLESQLKGLRQTMENAGQNGSEAYKAVSNLSQNVDFLHQINQTYTYIQLPLRLQQGRAQGDLYVYTNKRNLAEKDGKVSALLHLDMEHLGPVDVYVAMQNNKVNTKFYVCDDEMLDFLEAHMDLLTSRLQKRGYDISFSMETRGEKDLSTSNGGLAPLLEKEKGVALSQYAFDVRT